MNYFAHALPFLDRPYFVAGTGVPDWLTVADRKVRLRSKHVEAFLERRRPLRGRSGGRRLAAPSRRRPIPRHPGVRRDLAGLTVLVRDVLGGETGLRPAFLGHLLVELLLDAALIGR